jgi:hypothetical protein
MEEMCRETAKARAIFDRWMAFEPDHAAWMAYIKVRNNQLQTPTHASPMYVSPVCDVWVCVGQLTATLSSYHSALISHTAHVARQLTCLIRGSGRLISTGAGSSA